MYCFLQAPAGAAAAENLKGILLVILALALGTERWAKIIPGISVSKAGTYLLRC